MSDEMIIRRCAPTLAALKTGSLFNCPFSSREEMTDSLRALNRSLTHKGACAIPLRYENGKALIYLYRPEMLEKDLCDPLARSILKDCGYPESSPPGEIAWLRKRLRSSDSFPHEIGLFLGYPSCDVRGFIQHQKCKYTGLWKVFESDERQAQKHFRRCKHCVQAYLQRSQEGWSLSRLTVQPRKVSDKETISGKGRIQCE